MSSSTPGEVHVVMYNRKSGYVRLLVIAEVVVVRVTVFRCRPKTISLGRVLRDTVHRLPSRTEPSGNH